MLRAAVDLARATHPAPTGAVTVLVGTLALATGTGWARTVLLAAAVICGQFAVGLHNDIVDRDRDRAVDRTDKPVATGAVPVAAARAAMGTMLAGCVALSFALGVAPALAHLGAVAAAFGYNAWLKNTWWSWLPYAAAFALLPVVVWLVSPFADLPPGWLVTATALLGIGAHGANVLPDLADDRRTGVRGLPHRLPVLALRIGTASTLLAGLVIVTLAPAGGAPWEPWTVGAGALLAASTVLPVASHRWPLAGAIGIAALAAVILVARGAAA